MRFVPFKTQDNSPVGTWSSGKQGLYFHLSLSYLLVLNWLVWLDGWQSGDASCGSKNHESPASLGEHFGGRDADESSSNWPEWKQREDGLKSSYCCGLRNRTEYLLPGLVNVINLLVLVWEEEWQNVHLVLSFLQFHLNIFKYTCPVQICCPVNVWAVMRWMLLESKGLISFAVSILS